MIPNTVALDEYLKPLQALIEDSTVSEILINREKLIHIERQGFFITEENPFLSMRHLLGLANLIARYSGQRLSDKEPLLSAHLASGHRIQIILPPATANDRLVMSIRKQTINDVSLADYAALGAFTHTKTSDLQVQHQNHVLSDDDLRLATLFNAKDYCQFLALTVQKKKNILISGGTSTGKTTFLNAALKAIPQHEHLVTLEDVPELRISQPMHTPLFTSKGLQGVSQVTMQDLIQAALRIRPDRIIMGELRGAEAADFIHATATGHDGSLSSLHASSPAIAFMRLVHMVKLSGTNLSREDLLEDLRTVIDVVVQLRRRIEGNRAYREVSEIYYKGAVRS